MHFKKERTLPIRKKKKEEAYLCLDEKYRYPIGRAANGDGDSQPIKHAAMLKICRGNITFCQLVSGLMFYVPIIEPKFYREDCLYNIFLLNNRMPW